MTTLKLNLTDEQKQKLAQKMEQVLDKGKKVDKKPSSYVDPSLRK